MVRGSVGGQREGVGTAAADEKAAHVAQQPAWGGHWPWAATSCAGACARCSAEEASCDAALARAQRVELAEQPAQTALASRCAGALAAHTEGLPADVKSKLVLGLSCVAEGLHAAFLSEFDYAGEELRS